MFNDIHTNIERVFSSSNTAFTTLGIKVYPNHYKGNVTDNEWARLNVFTPGSTNYYRSINGRIRGSIVLNIFVPAGMGVRRATEVADQLDNLIGSANISGIQTTNSFITNQGIDSVNPGLYRVDLNINFNNYN